MFSMQVKEFKELKIRKNLKHSRFHLRNLKTTDRISSRKMFIGVSKNTHATDTENKTRSKMDSILKK